MSARNTLRRAAAAGLGTLCAIVGQTVLMAGPATAFNGYLNTPSTTFGAAGAGNGQLSGPLGMAVDDSSGDAYVVDAGNNRIEQFDAGGKYLSQNTGSETPAGSFSNPRSIAVDNSSSPAKGDVYVTDVGHSVIDVFAANGKYISQIKGAPASFTGELLGVAVDASGNVWAYEQNGNVDEFGDTGSYMSQFNTGRGANPGFAVDSNSNVYVLFGCGCVGKYSPTGTSLAEWGAGTALAVNEATNNVFLDTSSGIEEFGAGGEPYGTAIDAFGTGNITASEGIAVNDTTRTVYASQREADTVAVFKSVLLPDVSTEAATVVAKTSATLQGTVNPDGQPVTSCQFEYGTTTAYGQSAPCTPAPGSGSSPVPVSTKLNSLTPGATYHYRLLAGNSNGPHPGADQTFSTLEAVDSLQSEAAANIEKSGGIIVATLNGSLAPDGTDAHYYFEYGESEAYGSTSPAPPGTDAGIASKVEHAQTLLSGLMPGVLYHFRLVGVNSLGTTYGADNTFATPGAVEGVTTAPATEVLGASATLNGSLEPNGFDTHYWFEYGTSEAYGSSTIHKDAGEASEVVQATGAVAGLEPNTTYHYRLVAENAFGTTRGSGAEFTTSAAAPLIGSAQPAATTRITATVGWILNPENSSTSYQVLFGATSAYGEHSEMGSTSGTAEVPVALGLTGLTPDTTYHYALQATNQTGTVTGPDETFTTAPATPPAAVTGGSSNVVLTGATVSGVIEPAGLETSYEIDFGLDTSYGTSIYGQVGGGSEPVEVSAALQNLAPATTYHYRVVAINSDGIVYGADATFTTPVYSNPIILPSTLPLIASPSIAFPSEPTSTVIKKTDKKHPSKKRKRTKHRTAKAKGNARSKKKGNAHSKKK